MNDREMIEFWKANERPFGLCPEECREWLLSSSLEVEKFNSDGWTRHKIPSQELNGFIGRAVRIPADYQPEKRGRWVECEIREANHPYIGIIWGFDYLGKNDIPLANAPGMVGFGGVRYEGLPGWRQLGYETNKTAADSEPAKPIAVRFWVEE